jgi:hypothetical protein
MSLRFRAANKRLCVVAPLPTGTQQNGRLSRSFSAAPHSRQGSSILIIREREFNHG